MSLLQPQTTTIGDLCRFALRQSGAFGRGQTPAPDDVADAWAQAQLMLMQWEHKRWLVYHLVNMAKKSTGALSYTVGDGGDFDTGHNTQRPTKLKSGFTRLIQSSFLTEADYSWQILQSREDYDKIVLKSLQAGPGQAAWLDPDFPLAKLYVWPVPQANVYELHPTFQVPLPYAFVTLATLVTLPPEYYAAIAYPLALHLRPKYRIGTFPGDNLPGMAKDALNVLRTGNTQIAKLRMPTALRRRGGTYNIFGDVSN